MGKKDRKNPPDGMPSQRVLRGLMRAIAEKLRLEQLSVQETLALLKQQQRLSN